MVGMILLFHSQHCEFYIVSFAVDVIGCFWIVAYFLN